MGRQGHGRGWNAGPSASVDERADLTAKPIVRIRTCAKEAFSGASQQVLASSASLPITNVFENETKLL